jgi:ATP/maltotriose-dependent transcriptional regulator MalT
MVDTDFQVALAAQYWQWLGRCGIDGRLPTSKCLMAFEKAETLYRGLSNRRHVHACMRMRAEALLEFGDLGAAQLALHDAYELEQSGFTVADRMRRMRVQGLVHDAAGRYAQALQVIGDALLMATSNDIRRYAVTLANDLAGVQLHMGDASAAQAGLANLIAQFSSESSQGLTLSYARIRYAIALLMQDKVEACVQAALKSVRPLERSGILIARGDLFAWVLAASGSIEESAMLLGAAEAFRSERQLESDATEKRARDASLSILAKSGSQSMINGWMQRGAAFSETAAANLLATVLAARGGAEH